MEKIIVDKNQKIILNPMEKQNFQTIDPPKNKFISSPIKAEPYYFFRLDNPHPTNHYGIYSTNYDEIAPCTFALITPQDQVLDIEDFMFYFECVKEQIGPNGKIIGLTRIDPDPNSYTK